MSYADRIVPPDEIERSRKLAAARLRIVSYDAGRARTDRRETNADRIAALLRIGEEMDTATIARALGIRVGHASHVLKQMYLRGDAVRVARGLYRCPA